MSNLIWDIYGCWYGKGISQPTGIIMCSVEIHYKGLDENAVRKKSWNFEDRRFTDRKMHFFRMNT